jgi:hypothetical protein
MSESRILCEGFHDRAFWGGWLTHLGCSDEGFRPGTRGYPALDPFNCRVTGGGKYAYYSPLPGRRFICVAPCGGKASIIPQAKLRLDERGTKPLTRLVLNVDDDADVTVTSASTDLRTSHVLHFIREKYDPTASINEHSEIELDEGATRVALLRWIANDEVANGLPNQQCLERLVSAAIVAAYPTRADCVHNWLQSRSEPPIDEGPKAHAWSYMAGWYSDRGCEAFYCPFA